MQCALRKARENHFTHCQIRQSFRHGQTRHPVIQTLSDKTFSHLETVRQNIQSFRDCQTRVIQRLSDKTVIQRLSDKRVIQRLSDKTFSHLETVRQKSHLETVSQNIQSFRDLQTKELELKNFILQGLQFRFSQKPNNQSLLSY